MKRKDEAKSSAPRAFSMLVDALKNQKPALKAPETYVNSIKHVMKK